MPELPDRHDTITCISLRINFKKGCRQQKLNRSYFNTSPPCLNCSVLIPSKLSFSDQSNQHILGSIVGLSPSIFSNFDKTTDLRICSFFSFRSLTDIRSQEVVFPGKMDLLSFVASLQHCLQTSSELGPR